MSPIKRAFPLGSTMHLDMLLLNLMTMRTIRMILFFPRLSGEKCYMLIHVICLLGGVTCYMLYTVHVI